ncbi:hypothetical protein R5W23_000410 [Gemmata sp. JC673]|uniref:Uncharacterized protein n=1 Tax=Gemmata algarum TaxID=2975278 RepID=A0ABU5EWV3_9BACT|nr:hypothetical protein [Gemmata algarum]MDY3559418.1 hypothetical protein [Gemmata algarum]
MVTLHIGGRAVNWADAEKLFVEAARTQRIEFRDPAGVLLAATDPAGAIEPDWVRGITPEETARRLTEPGFTFEEMKQRLGWQ